MKGDLIQQYKLTNNFETVHRATIPLYAREITKNCNYRFNFFNNRVAKPWNQLPDHVVYSPSVNSFKKQL